MRRGCSPHRYGRKGPSHVLPVLIAVLLQVRRHVRATDANCDVEDLAASKGVADLRE